ncbi:IQ domain-containing protein IQM6-like [Gossypium australe]|uniref:IQ domain-containing protein IQM6-like n=1 Tax=Gossypium australe TaxID=47621 RepID=A0A5B6V480_9ROSI|nr:IQ domain-containing protein IQM6-like [Gossypium australe]
MESYGYNHTPDTDKESKVFALPESRKNVNDNNILQTSNSLSENVNDNNILQTSNSLSENVNDNNILQTSNSRSEKESHSDFSELGGQLYQAALKLQKVYRSFRTRRQLADCAVVAEQQWLVSIHHCDYQTFLSSWKLLDFVELKRSSISFFEIEKPESAVSRWFRARKRAAKVGKGISKDEKARKLALQHWLEATERENFEVVIRSEKLVYKMSEILLDTTGGPEDVKWIFVLSVSKKLYVGLKKKGTFQHSSFLAGGATLSAGRLVVENGVVKAIWPHSGHYLPTEENFQEFISFLREHNVDLTNVKKSPYEEEETNSKKNNSLRSNEATVGGSQQQTEATNNESSGQENSGTRKEDPTDTAPNVANKLTSSLSRVFLSKLSKLRIQKIHDVIGMIKTKTSSPSRRLEHQALSPSTEDGYETAEEILPEEEFLCTKINLFGEEDVEENRKPIPKEKIMKRIDSHKGLKSYQLAQQLSSKWSTGAGPRISCMRDYPSELQFRVLEQAYLTPRSRNVNASPRTTSRFSPSVLTPASLCK